MSKPTPRSYRTKEPVLISGFTGGGSLPYADFTVPAGLRCRPTLDGRGNKGFFLDELPPELFPSGSCLRHDATYYGVMLPVASVEDITPPPMDWPCTKDITPEGVVNALAQAVAETVVPYAMKRIKGTYVFLGLKPGQLGFIVTRRVGEVLEAKEEVLYNGFEVEGALRAFEEAAR